MTTHRFTEFEVMKELRESMQALITYRESEVITEVNEQFIRGSWAKDPRPVPLGMVIHTATGQTFKVQLTEVM